MRKSINKTTVIIVLTIFLSISVGYALFSDTITMKVQQHHKEHLI